MHCFFVLIKFSWFNLALDAHSYQTKPKQTETKQRNNHCHREGKWYSILISVLKYGPWLLPCPIPRLPMSSVRSATSNRHPTKLSIMHVLPHTCWTRRCCWATTTCTVSLWIWSHVGPPWLTWRYPSLLMSHHLRPPPVPPPDSGAARWETSGWASEDRPPAAEQGGHSRSRATSSPWLGTSEWTHGHRHYWVGITFVRILCLTAPQ